MSAVIPLLASLRRQVHALNSRRFERAWMSMASKRWPKFHEFYQIENIDALKNELIRTIEEFDAAFPKMEINAEILHKFHERDWFLGREFEVRAPRKILRGFIVPVRDVPTDVKVTLTLFALLTINNSKDLLDRHREQGFHYHYVISKGKRHTTTMICWDTRWILGSLDGLKVRPLFHELHGMGSKFQSAKPEKWGDKKRISIRDACKPDLLKWDIGKFRCASNRSSPVWPRSVTLTPRP